MKNQDLNMTEKNSFTEGDDVTCFELSYSEMYIYNYHNKFMVS